MVSRVYVEKKPSFDVEAQQLFVELRETVGVQQLKSLRMLNRYDVEGIDHELFERCVSTVFSEPQVDVTYSNFTPSPDETAFAVEFLPGQFDQRADSASECIQLISQSERPLVRSARVYVLTGALTSDDLHAIQSYVINPVEARLASDTLPQTLQQELIAPGSVEVLSGFCELDAKGRAALIVERGLAMDEADLAFSQAYFQSEKRDPTITELRVIDTYWSDHCRHTTFGTELTNISISDELVAQAFTRYLELRRELKREHKPVCLMDMGTIGAKYLRHSGQLHNLDESEEINACTVKCTVDVNGVDEDWLFLFKNETHNHPTEIEPFGGAATCIGGAIRDPLSGRSYVYQAMRVTGAADPRVPVSQTLPGKLAQRSIVTTAAAGYASYGNQIGLATGQVSELYHPGYVAKRMEVGAVVGAAPTRHVRRERPQPGDKIILLGGRTGRDGIGGATGSSKTQNQESVSTAGAEVQKGNAPVERKLQRLFRREDACRLIKRCNDFGAGGVSVAVGELAEGLYIDLDQVPKKYAGLDGTELAISESQERMAVAVESADVEAFLALAYEENLEATVIAEVTHEPRVRMAWNGDVIVDLSREFLSSNGAPKTQEVLVEATDEAYPQIPGATAPSLAEGFAELVSDINVCSNKGLSERFDSTIGAATVLMPHGGAQQLTPPQAMVACLPVNGTTTTVSGMAWGFNPYLMEYKQYTGAYLSVVESIARLVATGFNHSHAYLSFQEYFERLRTDARRWGKPVAAVLGALMAQLDMGVGAIGGKDSMSGSFEDLDVPPTLISFAVALGKAQQIVSPEFKGAENRVVVLEPSYDAEGLLPDAKSQIAVFETLEQAIAQGQVLAASTPGYGGIAEAVFKMSLGNRYGLQMKGAACELQKRLFAHRYGSFVVELAPGAVLSEREGVHVWNLGETCSSYELQVANEHIDLAQLQELWERGLEAIFPYRDHTAQSKPELLQMRAEEQTYTRKIYGGPRFARPRVVIPVFPGNNCEFDSARAFEAAGAAADIFVINNLSPHSVAESTHELAKKIRESQIVMIPGGFSGGDEPDGSAKFITAFFRAPEVTEAVRDLLQARDGLMLGICNGFQALVKLGLVPYGDIVEAQPDAPTLTFNTIGRHQSKLVRVRVASDLSPWILPGTTGDMYSVAISHGEGRFVSSEAELAKLVAQAQVVTQYVDEDGFPSMDLAANPNGSMLAIEGITSPDGRVLGKMGHTERAGEHLYRNIPWVCDMPLFENGVRYFA
ncbi:phosphoribosylformylglycinamidine synthase [Collinsella sp. zg1085]|uniref:phosphoribosylformylglycinamidine synthase n=1 Tax=Collinsella sp. zg1085 TaxID=2844380 RepID=UPI001C0D5B76|nr:phosphoribosylformylglycinamidine synthase [Collinsella sp. zg1085]QWT17979.1 phosphoribosylformylglycinamidine synthase [Collinsella sp. zg1085]